jgi:acetamidase/formamidase
MLHRLPADSHNVCWGYFDHSAPPAIRIRSGDMVLVETVTLHAGDAPELMMDDDTRKIIESVPLHERGPGPHILTGPIYVEDARPGDVLQVKILDLKPRMPYGSNLLASWGYLFEEYEKKERITIYKADDSGQWLSAVFAYDLEQPYPLFGRIADTDKVVKMPALENVQIPIRLHIGTMGVAMAETGRISTVPPGVHGGNLDNWKIGVGATMYYQVQVDGGLLSLGDCHLAQGDSELSGTAVEASMNCLLQVDVLKTISVPSPLLETSTHWITHGFSPDLNIATRQAALQMREFLTGLCGLTPEDAYSFMSLSGDFAITQVVDQQLGVHVSVPKSSRISPQFTRHLE